MMVDLDQYKARRELLQLSGKTALRKEIAEGGQSTVTHAIAWPWATNGHATEFHFKGQLEAYEVPMDGLYLVGAVAASGADVRHLFKKGTTNRGGRGASLACLLKLNKGQRLGVIVGGAGKAQYNGTSVDGDRLVSGGGGGATCVMLWHKNGTRAPILVAGGGGGATCTCNGLDASLNSSGRDAPLHGQVASGSGGLGQKPPRPGHNAISGGSGRGGEAYFAGGGAGFYGPGGVDSYFSQPGPTPSLAETNARAPRQPQTHREIVAAAAHATKARLEAQRRSADSGGHSNSGGGILSSLNGSNGSSSSSGGGLGQRRHHGGFGGGGAPSGKALGGGGGGGYGGGGGGMHGGGGGGSFVSTSPGVAILVEEVCWVGDGYARVERVAPPELSKLVPEARIRLNDLIAKCKDGNFRVVKSGSMEVIY